MRHSGQVWHVCVSDCALAYNLIIEQLSICVCLPIRLLNHATQTLREGLNKSREGLSSVRNFLNVICEVIVINFIIIAMPAT